MTGILDAMLSVVPALAQLPQPVFKPLGHPVFADMVDNDYFYYDYGLFKRGMPGPDTLVIHIIDVSVSLFAYLNGFEVPQILFGFRDAARTPEGYNGCFEAAKVYLFTNGRLDCRGTFNFLPAFDILGIDPLDWQVVLD